MADAGARAHQRVGVTPRTGVFSSRVCVLESSPLVSRC